jgi:hypothetical protein
MITIYLAHTPKIGSITAAEIWIWIYFKLITIKHKNILHMPRIHLLFMTATSKHYKATAESWMAFAQQINLNNSYMETKLKSK